MNKRQFNFKIKAAILGMAFCVLPSIGFAAGLGKITILSGLGQPLKAEIELSASRGELAGMSARLAPLEAYRQAGIEFISELAAIKTSIIRRPDGKSVVQLSGDRPVNEPFLDLLIQLDWASGKLVREYTFLLDPPESLMAKPAAEPVTLPAAKSQAAVAEVKPVASTALPATTPAKRPKAAAPSAEKHATPRQPASQPAAQTTPQSDSRTVKKGDTLYQIARETKPQGVSLEQTLAAIFQGNKDAFDKENINRLKAGRILKIPSKETAAAIAPAEARNLVVAHTEDFNAYSKKLAGAVAAAPTPKEAPAKQEAGGKITARVEDKAPAAVAGKDQLKISRVETAKDGGGKGDTKSEKDKAALGRITALEEDLSAKEKALKEASSRLAEIEKNANELKKLLELKNQALADLQKQLSQAAAKPPVAQAPLKQAEPAQPAVPTTPPAPAPSAAPTAEAKPADKPAEVAVVPQPDTAAKTPEVAPAQSPMTKSKPVTPPVEAEEPGLVATLIEDPVMLLGGGGALLALLLFGGYKMSQRGKTAGDSGSLDASTSLAPQSVFGETGGQSIDTHTGSIQTNFSQTPLDADTEGGVDPVAEADVYIAYGRDAQAEEILLDALKSEPARYAIHLKLLEIYALRKNAVQFEKLAKELHTHIGGVGPEWNKTVAMGHQLDPTNPLYGGTPTETPAAADADEEPDFMKTLVMSSGQAAQLTGEWTPPDVSKQAPTEQPLAQTRTEPTPEPDIGLDFDLGDLSKPAVMPIAQKIEPGKTPAPDTGLDFNFELGETGQSEAAPVTLPSIDLSKVNLDLGGAAGTSADDEGSAEMSTKLELAQAYADMGDKEGARELLQEVLKDGSTAAQGKARAILANLG